ncbi:MAG: PAS domain S-box protein [Arcobacter sp.]|uniref:PAS domain S-box protein n=1 Tax=Arcobacter sp. TaxID=1872629 RepID=UPI003CFDE081
MQGSIKSKLTFIILAVTTITSAIGYIIFISWYMNEQYKKTIELSNTIGIVISQDVGKLILLDDVSAAADISTQLKSFLNLQKLVLYKKDGTAILQYNIENRSFDVPKINLNKIEQTSKDDNLISIYHKATYQDTDLGVVFFEFKVESLSDIVKKDIFVIILIFMYVFGVSFILAKTFATKFTEPVLKLVSFLERIDKTESLSKRVTTTEKNEFGKLYQEVNTMLERIENSYYILKVASAAFETQSGMIITDSNQKILQVNKSFSKITGYRPNEVIGKTPIILKSGLHNREFYKNMFCSLKKNNFWMGEITNLRKDGSIINEHLIIQSVLDDKNEVIYYVASFLDTTKQKEIENQLEINQQILLQQSKLAAMGEMLENIAHQWKQPLSIITTLTSGILLNKELNLLTDEFLKDGLNNITNSVKYMSKTIDDFRNFYNDKLEKREFNLKNSIEKTLVLISSKLMRNNIIVVKNIDDILILGYENELIQVYMNILNNAIDSLENIVDETRIIKISGKVEENRVVIEFLDNAGGIKEEIMDKIFDSHFTTKDESKGTGIGLYMSKIIVTKVKGELSVSNKTFAFKEKNYIGANFKIILPLI